MIDLGIKIFVLKDSENFEGWRTKLDGYVLSSWEEVSEAGLFFP